MLLGEHAVLHGYRSVVCAINRRMEVQLSPLPERMLRIDSALGVYESSLEDLAAAEEFRFVIAAVKSIRSQMPVGVTLTIRADFGSDRGFGSSAAVTVCVVAALLCWVEGCMPDRMRLYHMALETVRAVQGCGSGADVAASVFGGCVGYTVEPQCQPVKWALPLTAVYCGYKRGTPEVIRWVEERFADEPTRLAELYKRIDECAVRGFQAIEAHNEAELGAAMTEQQHVMEELGLSTPELDEIIATLEVDVGVRGAKISGSGRGDCVVGLGRVTQGDMRYETYALTGDVIGCVRLEEASGQVVG